MEEGCHIRSLLQDLSVCIVVDELEKLVEDSFNTLDLF